jgi:hypothetical protein
MNLEVTDCDFKIFYRLPYKQNEIEFPGFPPSRE